MDIKSSKPYTLPGFEIGPSIPEAEGVFTVPRRRQGLLGKLFKENDR
jgi:hypothetical protein